MERLSGQRLVCLGLGLFGFLAALVASAGRTFRIGRGAAEVSITMQTVSPGAHRTVVVWCIAGACALLLAQAPRTRWVAGVGTLAGAGLIAGGFIALQNAQDYSGGVVDDLVTLAANARPTVAFSIMIGGAILALVASLLTLLMPRSSIFEARLAAVSGTNDSPLSGHLAPMTLEAGWYPDPLDAARWRWWDGSAWAASPMSQRPLPPPVLGS